MAGVTHNCTRWADAPVQWVARDRVMATVHTLMRHKTTVFETHIKNCHALFFWHPPSSGTLYSIHHLQLKLGENKFTE